MLMMIFTTSSLRDKIKFIKLLLVSQNFIKDCRTMLSGKSGHFINQLFAARLFDQDEKFVIAFHDPNKQIKLTTNKYSFKLSNIYVAAARLEIIDGVVKSYLPLATVVGPGKTISLSPMIAKIVKLILKYLARMWWFYLILKGRTLVLSESQSQY